MKCFSFSNGDKRVEPKSSKGMSVRPVSGSGSGSGSEPNSQNISSISNESSGRPTAPNVFDRPSNLRVFTFSELKLVTRNFTRSAMVGVGGFGSVYKGVIKNPEDSNRRVEVAVKQLDKKSMQGHKQWVTEVNVLGVVEHRNLVKLVGYCAEDDERGAQRLLVYEYMPNGSVDDHLSLRSKQPLPWAVRLRIAQDAARGLAYLHEGMDFQIIFRDFKSSNILLDEQWNAKLSDFGLARLGPEEGFTHVSTAVMGTLGYTAPEYMQSGRLTAKSDVWGYGVFLFELITGRRPLDRNRPKNEQNLLEWLRPYVSDKKRFNLIIDPRLEGDVPLGSVQRLAILANDCLIRNQKSRPSMSEVLGMVNKIVEESTETGSPRPPSKSSTQVEISRNVKSMKGVGDSRIEEGGGFIRRWASKLVKTH